MDGKDRLKGKYCPLSGSSPMAADIMELHEFSGVLYRQASGAQALRMAAYILHCLVRVYRPLSVGSGLSLTFWLEQPPRADRVPTSHWLRHLEAEPTSELPPVGLARAGDYIHTHFVGEAEGHFRFSTGIVLRF